MFLSDYVAQTQTRPVKNWHASIRRVNNPSDPNRLIYRMQYLFISYSLDVQALNLYALRFRVRLSVETTTRTRYCTVLCYISDSQGECTAVFLLGHRTTDRFLVIHYDVCWLHTFSYKSNWSAVLSRVPRDKLSSKTASRVEKVWKTLYYRIGGMCRVGFICV